MWSGRVGRGGVVLREFFDTESIFLGGRGEYFFIN